MSYIHEIKHPGRVIEQRLLSRDAAAYLSTDQLGQAEREHLRSLGWIGPKSLRTNGIAARTWVRFITLVEPS